MGNDSERDTRTQPRTNDPDCLFCKIAAGDVDADVVTRTDRVVAFRDLNPQAPLHVLVIPRDHHADVGALAHQDAETLAELVRVGSSVAADEAEGQFRLVFNTGRQTGQSVFHVHGHVLGGRSMTWPPG
jgi:histidine triad (HIT) family protein